MGRRTFIDDIVGRAKCSTGSQCQGSSYVIRGPITPRFEASVSMVENKREVVTPSGVPIDTDRAIVVGGGETEVVYHIVMKEVTKEEWLQLWQEW